MYVYVTDTRNNRIEKFDTNGKLITKWGSNGRDDGEFKTPGKYQSTHLRGWST